VKGERVKMYSAQTGTDPTWAFPPPQRHLETILTCTYSIEMSPLSRESRSRAFSAHPNRGILTRYAEVPTLAPADMSMECSYSVAPLENLYTRASPGLGMGMWPRSPLINPSLRRQVKHERMDPRKVSKLNPT
jgi:hypothetical protein